MGIVNVTPDSFSDGGEFLSPQAAVEHALQLVADGADILDIGGESTRPYAAPVSPVDELRRVVPVIEALRAAAPQVLLSIDTSKSQVARAALDLGAEIVNDVTAGAADAAMPTLIAESGSGFCAMHMQGTPATMQDDPRYLDVVGEVKRFLAQRLESMAAVGVSPERICVDPGLGFGKTREHNLTLLAECGRFHELGAPVLIGHSRKGFWGKIAGEGIADRDAATVGAAIHCALAGVQVLRVHNVRMVRAALAAFDACQEAATDLSDS